MENRYDGTRDAATDLALRVLNMPERAGSIELPSGRRVAADDPEYCEWFFASIWGTVEKAATWFAVPSALFLAACEGVSGSSGLQPSPRFVWQTHMLAAMVLSMLGSPLTEDSRRHACDRMTEALNLTRDKGMHIIAKLNIDTACRRGGRVPAVDDDAPSTFLYFLRRPDGYIKIGKSDSPQRRARAIANQSGLDVALCAAIRASERDEKWAHAIFASSRSIGEWFAPSEELVALVDLAARDGAAALRVIRASRTSANAS